MIKFTVVAIVGAAALFAGNARAADSLAISEHYANEAHIAQRARTVCDDYGRCWYERTPRRVIIEQDREPYYGPRERYVERRYDPDRPPAHVGIYAPNVRIDLPDDDDED